MAKRPMISQRFQFVSTPATARRIRRIYILLLAVCIMAMGDLYSTIVHSQSIGMVELNPIGAMLINSGSEAGLIFYKIGCTVLSCGLILMVRHQRSAEFGSWTLMIIMTLLTLHWYSYNQAMAKEMVGIDISQATEIMHMIATAK